jgi:predicted RNase H-like HicB family nuclease
MKMIFNAIIEKDENGYFASIPELEGCISQGDTYEEVINNIKEALDIYLESLSSKEKEELFKRKIISVAPLEVEVN